MRSERPWLRVLWVVALLGLGMAVAYLRPSPHVAPGNEAATSLWLERPMDLVVQLGLMIVGALGIRTLLPREEEQEDEAHGRMD